MRKILCSLLMLTLTSACATAVKPPTPASGSCKSLGVSVERFSSGQMMSKYEAIVPISFDNKHYHSSRNGADFIKPDGSIDSIHTEYFDLYIKDSGRSYIYTVSFFEGDGSVFSPIAEGIRSGELSPNDAQLLFNEAASRQESYVDSTVYASFEYGESGKKVKRISDTSEVHITNMCRGVF